tara:strand:- start:1798 stop:2046 length:249 start_codon:yes stop_codon:yes gene_type:complete
MKTDLGTQIKNYIDWYLYECNDQIDELEYLINLIIDSGGKEREEIIEVLEMTTEHKVEKCDQMEIIDYQNNRKEMLKKLKTK